MLDILENMEPVLTLNSVVDGGEYNGYTINDILEVDPSFITWLLHNTPVQLSDEVQEKYDRIDLKRKCAGPRFH